MLMLNSQAGFCAFTHKAGIHAKAILASPSTYEVINPSDFGMTRYGKQNSRSKCNVRLKRNSPFHITLDWLERY